MKTNRLFHSIVALVLLLIIGFTVREAAATTAIVKRQDSAEPVCASLPSRYSIRTEYVERVGAWVTFTEDGPTGVDGGLIDLLSSYRTCSK